MAKNKVTLPEGYNPEDMELKKLFHEKADALNKIHKWKNKKHPELVCGAMRASGQCNMRAGGGTDHEGYGRCKYHGGSSTGPTTEEGKMKVRHNARIHGIYASVLPENEKQIFDELAENHVKGLEFEINMLKAKIISYLERKKTEFDEMAEKFGADAAYDRSKVFYNESDSGARNYYHAATIEDRVLDKSLHTLAKLVEKHNKLTGSENSEDFLATLNSELVAASKGNVNISWEGPQTRQK